MLSRTKPNVSFTRALVIALGAALVGTGVIYSYQANNMSLQLADKSATIELQNHQILQYVSTIESQNEEIAAKTMQLQSLNAQIAELDSEISAREKIIAAKNAEAQSLRGTVEEQRELMQQLQAQALLLQNQVNQLKQEVQNNEVQILDLTRQVKTTQAQLDSTKRIKVSHYGLGVTQNGAGVVFPIEVEILGSGDGTISVDVKNVLYEASFQDAVRTAANVASDYTDISVSDKDIIIRFVHEDEDDLVRVDGGSAGALITAMIIAGLTDREINSSVLVTGTIKSDGDMGRIGGLEGKTEAAVEFGATTMLVPKEQEFWHDSIRVVGVHDIDDVVRYLVLR